MHPGQLALATDDVRRLIVRQFPQWADLAVTRVASAGTVNALFKLGDSLVARFPLEPGDAEEIKRWLEAEAAAAAELFGQTRFPTPEPVALGEPGPAYPLPWSIQTWIPGRTAIEEDPGTSEAFAEDLAEFIRGVRAIDTRGRTFNGKGRGGDLRASDDWMATCFKQSENMLDVALLRSLWAEWRTLPRERPDVMNHRDLIPGNVLVAGVHGKEARLAGVLDVGGLRPADPAVDLIAAWALLEAGPRQAFRVALEPGDLDWARGRAWAFEQAMGLVWYYAESNPTMSALGRRTLSRIITSL